MTAQRAPKLFRIRTEDDLATIPFHNGIAAVELPACLLHRIDWKNQDRGASPRLSALERSIRNKGYQPVEPITARIGKRGRWIVMNGGHRVTAADHVMREFWTNLFGPKVQSLYVVLFTTEKSWSKFKGAHPSPNVITRDNGAASRASWERARRRMAGAN